MAVEEVFVVGTSQSVAPVAVRERLYVDLEEVYRAPTELLVDRGVLQEALPLSTCGRLELYGVSENPERALKLLVRLLAERARLDREQARSHMYALRGATAVRHLFRVASGLDSVVHGEAQILGQVRAAAYDPRAEHTKGPVLHRLFETALATGKKVRSQTEIGRGAASLASASIEMIQRDLGDLGDVSALVVGTGDTGRLIALILSKLGVGRLVLANRTIDVAQA
ncbi:MAG: glutamyl-tRNA reductase, partial [Longimicrobiales bacterium]